MKRLRGILLFLVAGAILNVLVAWGIAVSVDTSKATPEKISLNVSQYDTPERVHIGPVQHVHWNLQIRRRFGSVDVMSPDEYESALTYSTLSVEAKHEVIPNWAHLAEVDGVGTTMSCVVHLHSIGRGWPCISMKHEEYRDTQFMWGTKWRGLDEADGNVTSGVELKVWPWEIRTWAVRYRVLPMRLVFRGFVVNSLFYAILLWLSFAARRLIRRKRGGCSACGYDLRGNVKGGCPECGWGRERSTP